MPQASGETVSVVRPRARRGDDMEADESGMAERLRFGLVGAGMMGREHIRNLKLFPQVEITALADPTESSLASALETVGATSSPIKTFADSQGLAASGAADAIIVASPNFTHRAVLEPLLASGLPILCEKPLCTTVEDARWVCNQVQGRTVPFWTGMEYRYMPPVTRFVERIHAGDIGRLVMLSIREHRFPFLPKVGDWNRFSRNTGGTMVEKCCHFFDLMRLIVGAEAVRVFCSGAMDVNHLDERYGGEAPDIIDNSYTVVDFANGARAMLDLSMFAEGEEQQEAIAGVGDKAKLEVTIPAGDLAFSPRTPLRAPKAVVREHVAVDEAALKAGSHHGATYYQLAAFIDAVEGRAPVVVTAEDGLKAVAIGAAAELSARERRVVNLSEFA
jgi:myo-inositol 2-dehydrogenase/D-chiro-inositol 1-dehydrogenase